MDASSTNNQAEQALMEHTFVPQQPYMLTEEIAEVTHPDVQPNTRLLPALPVGAFINKPEEVDRFMVRVWPDGTVYFKGSRERVEEFLRLCEQMGVHVNVDHIALCG